MILREWRGRASPLKAEAYPAHFRRNVLPELAGVPGFLAGLEIDRAIVEPGALAALTDFDACVRHYEVIEDS